MESMSESDGARHGDWATLWRQADLAKDDPSGELPARWQRQAIAAEWGGGEVVVDQNTYRIFSMEPGRYRTQDFGAHVRGEPDDAVRRALAAAVDRLMCVGDDGVEYPDAETALDDAGYSPNYVSEPTKEPGGGWSFWIDCQGEVYPLMAATHLRILIGELHAAGVSAIRIGPVD